LPGGAEDNAYLQAKIPYRTANALMADASELRAVAGVAPALYTRLAPFICALPVAELSPININTLLPDQAALLAMLAQGLDAGRARAIIASRPAGGFDSLISFWKLPGLAGASPAAIQQSETTTRWFTLRLLITLNGAEMEETALIDAGEKPARLVRRSFGAPS
jgi:general secretion pathway protein K